MAEEYEKYALMRNLFRRRSSTEFTGTGFSQLLEARQVPSILTEMGSLGSRINPTELQKHIEQVDGERTGKLTFEQYQQLCDRFIKDTSTSRSSNLLKGFTDFDA